MVPSQVKGQSLDSNHTETLSSPMGTPPVLIDSHDETATSPSFIQQTSLLRALAVAAISTLIPTRTGCRGQVVVCHSQSSLKKINRVSPDVCKDSQAV